MATTKENVDYLGANFKIFLNTNQIDIDRVKDLATEKENPSAIEIFDLGGIPAFPMDDATSKET